MINFEELNKLEKSIYKSLLSSQKLKKDLMNEFNLPRTTINRALQNLIKKNLIKENGLENSTGGRPPIVYAPSKTSYYIIGLDISRSYSEIIIVDSSLNIIFKDRFNMSSDFSPENTIIKLNKILVNAISKLNLNKEKILGIGLGVVDPFDIETGILGPITNSLNNQWIKLNIKDLCNRYFDIPVLIDRGTNMAAFGEFFININNCLDKIVYLNLGRGIRYGLVDSGKIINSYDPIYDALGHMIINLNGDKCQCGKFGCLELYGTIASIEKNFNSSNNKNDNYIDEIISKYNYGDLNAKKAIDKTLFSLAIGINNLSNIINPDKFIINGPLIQKDPYIFNKIIQYIKNLNNNDNKINSIYSNDSYFGENIISMGAAITFIIQYIN